MLNAQGGFVAAGLELRVVAELLSGSPPGGIEGLIITFESQASRAEEVSVGGEDDKSDAMV